MALQQIVESKHVVFRHPFTCICVGPTMSGKTSYITNLIKNKNKVIKPNVKRVIYSYKKYQPIFDSMPGVEFIQGMHFKLDKSVPTLLVIDDQMNECNATLTDLFSVGAHHDNCSVIFVSQVLFLQDKAYRSACQNAMYMILFRFPRCKAQIGHLARQMFTGNKAKRMIEAFEDATAKPFSNLIVDCKPDTPDLLRLRSNVLPGEGIPFGVDNLAHVYVI